MAVDFLFKDKYNINDLIEIVRILRAPGGCPWDIKQTHASIKKDFIEETYEVVEAINKDDKTLLCEELGDVLLQVAFHSDIERENGTFDFDDVADGICKKLIIRHPHVFGDVKADTADEVLTNWDEIKRRTKHQKSVAQSIDSIPRELPALMRAAKIQSRAAKTGFDFDSTDSALDKITEETAELKEAVASGDKAKISDELGDLLFAAVNVARFTGVEAEESLTASSDKFSSRFKITEELAKQKNIDMKSASIKELDVLWDETKKLTK